MVAQKKLIDKLQNEKLKPVLETILQYGLTSHRIVRDIEGLEEHQVTYAFNKLLALNVIEPIQSSPVHAERSGRSEKPYVLTRMGVDTLKELGYENTASLDLDGPADVAHRLCMGLVASQARNSGELEKVIPYAPGRSVRTDVYVETRDGVRLIEIEQALDSNNKDRAVAKLKGYAGLFAANPPDLIPELMIIFNLPKSNLEHTLKVWQLALRDAGDLPFPIYTSTLEIFMYMPDFSNWSTLDRLSASEKKRRTAEPLNIPGEIPHENPLEGLDPAATLTSRAETIRARMSVVTDFDAARRFDLLGRFAWSFYEPDFNEHTGQTLLYNADPVNSLGGLREFLYDPRHKPLFELMKRKVANFRKQTTITVQMTAALEMAWSFLSAFGLKEGGPLNVYANAPMVGDNADRLQYKLDLKNNRFEVDEGRKEEYQKAILWLLNTFLFYPRELGLVDEPRKQR